MLINVRLLSLFYGTYGCMQLHCLMYWVLEWLYGESVQFRTLYPVSNSGTLDSVCCLRFLFPLSIGWWVTLGSKEPAWFFQFCSLWWFLVVIWFDFVLDAILIFGFCALVSTLWLFYCAAECYVCVFVVLCIIGFRLSPLSFSVARNASATQSSNANTELNTPLICPIESDGDGLPIKTHDHITR